MQNKTILIGGGAVFASIFAAVAFWPSKAKKAEKQKPETASEPATDDAAEEKKRLMRELARKGGKKSAETRRKKAAAKKKGKGMENVEEDTLA